LSGHALAQLQICALTSRGKLTPAMQFIAPDRKWRSELATPRRPFSPGSPLAQPPTAAIYRATGRIAAGYNEC